MNCGLFRGVRPLRTLSRRQPMSIGGSVRRGIVGTTSSLLENAVLKSVKHRYGFPLPGEKSNTPMVVQARPEHGDYQCTVAMSLAKQLKMKPRDVADSVLQDLQNDPELCALSMVDKMDISGPGFINMRLSVPYVETKLREMQESGRMGVPLAREPQRVVVDFSSPNIAKEMHVGHLRSTIIGDCLSRVLEYLGHKVLRLNHVGDWGTQFGMLIHYLKTRHPQALSVNGSEKPNHVNSPTVITTTSPEASLNVEIGDLVEFYKAAKRCFDEDNDFKEAARAEVVRLQRGDPRSLQAWQLICHKSRTEFQHLYDLLNVRIEERGESFYNPLLPDLVAQLKESGAVVESEGAQCVFLEGFRNTDDTPLPLIVQKSDGGFLYATTDLAALAHRISVEKAQRILYVTDAGQAQHFQMVFQTARKAGFASAETELVHVPFGLVLGEDGKKIKSRSGDSVKLRELLDEAVRRAKQNELTRLAAQHSSSIISSSTGGEDGTSTSTNPHTHALTNTADTEQTSLSLHNLNLSKDELHSLNQRAQVLGLGAVKYADLSMHRESNYRFSFAKMLSLTGNTAPYMIYAYVRIRGIQRKAAAAAALTSTSINTLENEPETSHMQSRNYPYQLSSAEEVALGKHLIRFADVVTQVGTDLCPSRLCDYIFELSQRFNQFYESCPVLQAESAELRHSRTQLCALTADTLKLSLELLGIDTVEKM